MSRNLPNEITVLEGRVTDVENTGGGGGGGGLLTFASYAAAKAANYSAVADGTVIYIKGRTATAGGGGVFEVDKTDTTTADNDGTVLVATGGVRLKRDIEGKTVNMHWWVDSNNADGNDISAKMQAAINYATANNLKLEVPGPTGGGVYHLTQTVTIDCKELDCFQGADTWAFRWRPTNPTAACFRLLGDGVLNGIRIDGPTAYTANTPTGFISDPSLLPNINAFTAGATGFLIGFFPGDTSTTGFRGYLNKCYVSRCKYGYYVNTPGGHVTWNDCDTHVTVFGIYFYQNNDDYMIRGGNYGCVWASIGCNNLGNTLIERAHFGFGPYGLYQTIQDGFVPNHDINGLIFNRCHFEQLQEAAIVTRDTADFYNVKISNTDFRSWSGWAGYTELPASYYGTGPGKIAEQRREYFFRLGTIKGSFEITGCGFFSNPQINFIQVRGAYLPEFSNLQLDRGSIDFTSLLSGWTSPRQDYEEYNQSPPTFSAGNLLGNPEDTSAWTNGSSTVSLTSALTAQPNTTKRSQVIGGVRDITKALVFSIPAAGGKDLVLSGTLPAGGLISCEFMAYSPDGVGIRPEVFTGSNQLTTFRGTSFMFPSSTGWERYTASASVAGGALTTFRLSFDRAGTVYIANLRLVSGSPAGYSRTSGPSVSTPFAMPAFSSTDLPNPANYPHAEIIVSDAARGDGGLGVKAISLQASGGGWAWLDSATYAAIATAKSASQYLAQLTGTYSTAEQNAITAFYSNIASIRSKLIAVYLGRLKNSGDSLINLVSNDHTATLESGGPGFTADAGWGTGAGLFNTNFNPVTHGRWTSTSATFGAYYESVGTGRALNGIAQDASSGGQRVYISPDPSGNTEYALNSPSDSVYAGFAAGLWSIRRSGTAIELYQGATAVDTESNTASSLLNDTLTMTGHGTGYRISMLYIAEGLTAGEISTLNSAYNTLRATL